MEFEGSLAGAPSSLPSNVFTSDKFEGEFAGTPSRFPSNSIPQISFKRSKKSCPEAPLCSDICKIRRDLLFAELFLELFAFFDLLLDRSKIFQVHHFGKKRNLGLIP